jgi:hypothetical protein
MSKVAVLPPEPPKMFLVKIGRTSFAVPAVIAAAGEDAARRFRGILHGDDPQ